MTTASSSVHLHLEVSDPEVVAALVRFPEETERVRFALAALRVGVLAFGQASGALDGASIREAGRDLIARVERVLQAHAAETTGRVEADLKHYLDPSSGVLPTRVQALVQPGGELERVLRAHLSAEDSVLARSMARHIGQESPIFRMLSPDEADGLLAQLARRLETALGEQRKALLAQFSLDQPDSALSRLVGRVDQSQARISADLSIDNEQSSLFRLKRELKAQVEELVARNREFQTEVRSTLAGLQARRDEERRSTRHGLVFEEALGSLLTAEAQRLGDICDPTGSRPGSIKNCKTGDFVATLGQESAAPGARIAWEAKEEQGRTLPSMLEEIDLARRNRDARFGVFVLSAASAPPELAPFARHGSDLVVIWNPEDSLTDIRVQAAYSVARALVVREAREAEEHAEIAAVAAGIYEATRAVEKRLNDLASIGTWAETVRSSGEKIAERARIMGEDVRRQVARLDEVVRVLRAGEAG